MSHKPKIWWAGKKTTNCEGGSGNRHVSQVRIREFFFLFLLPLFWCACRTSWYKSSTSLSIVLWVWWYKGVFNVCEVQHHNFETMISWLVPCFKLTPQEHNRFNWQEKKKKKKSSFIQYQCQCIEGAHLHIKGCSTMSRISSVFWCDVEEQRHWHERNSVCPPYKLDCWFTSLLCPQ